MYNTVEFMASLYENNATTNLLLQLGYAPCFKAWIVYKNNPAPFIRYSFDMVNSISQVRAGYVPVQLDFVRSYTALVNLIEGRADKITRAKIFSTRNNIVVREYETTDAGLTLISDKSDEILYHPNLQKVQNQRAQKIHESIRAHFEKNKK